MKDSPSTSTHTHARTHALLLYGKAEIHFTDNGTELIDDTRQKWKSCYIKLHTIKIYSWGHLEKTVISPSQTLPWSHTNQSGGSFSESLKNLFSQS